MPIKLAISGCAPIVVTDNEITIGSTANCTVSFLNTPHVKSKHAVIRLIAGRWLVEVRDGDAIFVGTDEPKRMKWLQPGDVIRLSAGGPSVTFQPNDEASISSDLPLSRSPSNWSSTRTLDPPGAGEPPQLKSPCSAEVVIPTSSSSASLQAVVPQSNQFSDASMKMSTSENVDAGDSFTGLNLALFDNQRASTDSPSESSEASPPPLLRRMSGYEQPVPDSSFSETAKPPVDPDITWIWNVVTRCVLAGVAFLVVWLTISELWKLFNAP